MSPSIPKEIEPHFNALFSKSTQYAWLNHFYYDSIRQLIKQTIEEDFFPNLQLGGVSQSSLRLKQLQSLQEFFEYKYRGDKRFLPLQKPFKELDHLVKLLEDEYIRALARGDIDKPLSYGLPSYTPEVLREILTREILRYLKSEVKHLKRRSRSLNAQTVSDLEYWCDKELGNLDPVYVSVELDTKRFSLLHDPQAQDLDFGQLLSNGWYFLNGTDRIPLFLQYELATLKRMWKMIRSWVYNISQYGHEKRLIGFGLPLASVWFLMDCLYLCFLPYRFVRTMANELTDLVKQGLNSLFSRYFNMAEQNSDVVKLMQLLLIWGAYAALLWGFGLPFLPNPLAWQPQMSLSSLLMIPLGFAGTMLVGGLLHAWSSVLYPDSYHVMQKSADQVEKTVEKGIQSLQKVHGDLFDRPKPVLHAFNHTLADNVPDEGYSSKPRFKY